MRKLEKIGVKDLDKSLFIREIPLMTERTSFIVNGVWKELL